MKYTKILAPSIAALTKADPPFEGTSTECTLAFVNQYIKRSFTISIYFQFTELKAFERVNTMQEKLSKHINPRHLKGCPISLLSMAKWPKNEIPCAPSCAQQASSRLHPWPPRLRQATSCSRTHAPPLLTCRRAGCRHRRLPSSVVWCVMKCPCIR